MEVQKNGLTLHRLQFTTTFFFLRENHYLNQKKKRKKEKRGILINLNRKHELDNSDKKNIGCLSTLCNLVQ